MPAAGGTARRDRPWGGRPDARRTAGVHIETLLEQPERCVDCESIARVKDRDRVRLVDLPSFGRRARLVWRTRRGRCPDDGCPAGIWTEQAPAIAAARLGMTDRAGRWATFQVGAHGRAVAEVARDLGCEWHTVTDAVIAYGTKLVDDPDRIGTVTALGLDETQFVRRGPGGPSRGRPRSWTCVPGCCWTSLKAAMQLLQPRGWPRVIRHGATRSCTRRWTCRAPTGRCSTRCCPTRSRSLIRSTSGASPATSCSWSAATPAAPASTRRWPRSRHTTGTPIAPSKSKTLTEYPPRPITGSATSAPRCRGPGNGQELLRDVYAADDLPAATDALDAFLVWGDEVGVPELDRLAGTIRHWRVRVLTYHHITLGASGTIDPSWGRRARRPRTRWGASSPSRRISRSTRLPPTWMLWRRRRCARTLR